MRYAFGPLIAATLLAAGTTGLPQKGAALKDAKPAVQTQSPKALNAQQIFEQFHDSIVRIETDKKQGTGFFLRDGQTVATAYHVLAGASQIAVYGSRRETWVPVICYLDEKADIAILGFAQTTSHKPIRLADFAKLKPGSDVTVISNALGLDGSVSTGVLSERRIRENTELIQFSAAVSPGSSGAPVLNSAGEAAGIVISTVEGGQAVNLAAAEPAIHRLLERDPQPVATFLAATAAEEAERKKKQDEEDAEKQRNEAARIAGINSEADTCVARIVDLSRRIAQIVEDFNSKQKELAATREQLSRDRDAADRNFTAVALTQGHLQRARDKYAEDKRQADEAAKNDAQGYVTAAWVAILIGDQQEIDKQQKEFERLVQRSTDLKIFVRKDQDKANDLAIELEGVARAADQLKADLDQQSAALERVCLASQQSIDPAKDIAGDWLSSDGGVYRFTLPSAFTIEYKSDGGGATITGQFETLGGRLNLSINDVKVKADHEKDQAEADKLAATLIDGKKNGTNTWRNFQLWKSKTQLTIIDSNGKRFDLTRKS